MKLIVTLVAVWLLQFHSAFAAAPARVVFLGDSLTDGYGVAKEDAYPALIAEKFKQAGRAVEVVNSSISGSTSASAVSRVKWNLKAKPDVLVLALGANDGLRGLSVKEMKKNLAEAIDLAQKNGIKVVLAGMKSLPNYGRRYGASFENVYMELAKEKRITLIPFLLEGVAGESHMNQADGVHPNEKGQHKMADVVYPFVEKALKP